MRMDLTATDRAAVPGILAAVKAEPGVIIDELQRTLGHPEYRIRKVLNWLRRSGEIGLVRIGQVPRWYPPAEAIRVRAEAERVARIKRRERNRIYSSRFNEKLRAGLLDDDGDDGKPVRIRADASAPLPFVCRAPASVFHIGSGL